jgi:hypothetical protein
VANSEQVSQLTNSIQGQLEVGNRDMPFRMANCGRNLIRPLYPYHWESKSLVGRSLRGRNFAVA